MGFISKWKSNTQTEKQIAQAHFNDLCLLFDHPTPADDDPSGDHFAFEKAATKIGGGKGYADVWKKDYFAWEYKSRDENLEAAHKQLTTYAPALGNPPLQVVCDFNRYRIHTAWTNTVPETHELLLDEFIKPDRLQILRNVFHDPEKLKPVRVRSALTKEAADKFATIAFRMQGRGTPEEIAHFVNQLVFCFFADSVGLLPKGMWSKLLARAQEDPVGARGRFDTLFAAMRSGEDYGAEKIVHFNGGLFDGQRALPLDEGDIGLLRAANTLDWSQIDPSIFGSLFERFLDPQKRKQIGAHYTDAEKIQKIIEPVILRPLQAEWNGVKIDIEALLKGKKKPPMRAKPRRPMKPLEAAEERRAQFLKRLKEIKILDPACGSGNFLYLALQGVKDIEHQVNLESERMGLKPQLPFIGPEILKGIEINPVAAELARTTIWIGDIQWRIRNGINSDKRPVLEKLDAIVCGDALIAKRNDGSCEEAQWPDAEFVVGNPPFLGDRRMITALGERYVTQARRVYSERLPGHSDLVCYWFAKGLDHLKADAARIVGFVATNSISGGNNISIMDRITSEAQIFEAWSDEEWVVEGAAVRVAIICFARTGEVCAFKLEGRSVAVINSDLTSGQKLTTVRRLRENRGISFVGTQKNGPFDVPGEMAREWLRLPTNPNGKKNSDVVRPWTNGSGLVRRDEDRWVIDFGADALEEDAALFEAPFQHVLKYVKSTRLHLRRQWHRTKWWLHGDPRPALRCAVSSLSRFVATPLVSKHRIFVWLPAKKIPENTVIVVARDDDTTFGILHSRFHESWSLRQGTWLGVGNDPRYTPTTTFETFPFPKGLTPNVPASAYANDPRAIAIAKAAKRLESLRNSWLNPPDLVDTVPEVVHGYPDRVLPKTVEAAAILKKRTLTNLYNEPPQWLADAHRDLDAAVAVAYGWPADISEDDALAELLKLNLMRVAAQEALSGKDDTVAQEADD